MCVFVSVLWAIYIKLLLCVRARVHVCVRVCVCVCVCDIGIDIEQDFSLRQFSSSPIEFVLMAPVNHLEPILNLSFFYECFYNLQTAGNIFYCYYELGTMAMKRCCLLPKPSGLVSTIMSDPALLLGLF